MADGLPANLLKPLLDLGRWLDAIQAQSVIVGGVAASFLGRPRFTQDIDALAIISESEWSAAVGAASNYGIVPRIDDAVEFARRSRVLLLRHQETQIDIDIILGGLPFEEDAVTNGKRHIIGGVTVRLPKVEDLVIMKAVAHRPRDLQDIEGLLQVHPNLDLSGVRQWVREFASVTGMSELIEDFDKLLARVHRTP
ncbi:nucleotidyl transferase AbiEii/AbiGii toxin family protein [Steroidobacter sp.]|uniref:nucleotidyl transferase AbiEii/AbiGii toxin family protein n=1 Tax=Steroidobacter sp. TaxID=1978227 RepID=UPI001A3BE8EB|nr:nucleotidyl transferase AbiEii/AbiGii toxin family protein [Steroidobacter sp.]MBL8271557.1 nucleotidyltransferase [Steroidobacter sp.]